jgi:hypothetical protein
MWIDVLIALLSIIIIPYGFMKRKKSVRIFAGVALFYALIPLLFYMVTTGEKIIGYLFFAVVVVSLLYLFSTTMKNYFGNSTAHVPRDIAKEYTYGLYTLYTELVRLKNGKNQIIYFFSKKTPKSGTPTTLPQGFHVEVSTRSGLPYLKKDPGIFST